MYITTEGVKSEQAVREDSAKITIQATGATSWRRADVKYRKNEAFVDVIENVNLMMGAKGASHCTPLRPLRPLTLLLAQETCCAPTSTGRFSCAHI